MRNTQEEREGTRLRPVGRCGTWLRLGLGHQYSHVAAAGGGQNDSQIVFSQLRLKGSRPRRCQVAYVSSNVNNVKTLVLVNSRGRLRTLPSTDVPRYQGPLWSYRGFT